MADGKARNSPDVEHHVHATQEGTMLAFWATDAGVGDAGGGVERHPPVPIG